MMEVIISIFLGCDLAMNNQEKLNVQEVQTRVLHGIPQ